MGPTQWDAVRYIFGLCSVPNMESLRPLRFPKCQHSRSFYHKTVCSAKVRPDDKQKYIFFKCNDFRMIKEDMYSK